MSHKRDTIFVMVNLAWHNPGHARYSVLMMLCSKMLAVRLGKTWGKKSPGNQNVIGKPWLAHVANAAMRSLKLFAQLLSGMSDGYAACRHASGTCSVIRVLPYMHPPGWTVQPGTLGQYHMLNSISQ